MSKYDNWSKEKLISEIKLLKKTTYGLLWDDKPEDVADLCKTKLPVLVDVEDKEISDGPRDPTNILIEGDNYHALSVLNYTHKGKIDIIYIDPPYNRGVKGGNDFRYNDKFVDGEDPFRHSKWLSFMEKRLNLAKNLLKNTGSIFISIDNTEQSALKLLCDKVFGEKNFVGMLIWRKKEGGGQADAYFVTEHEYILAYAKSDDFQWKDEEIPVSEAEFKKQDEQGKFSAVKLAKWGNTARREDRPKMYFPIKSPDGNNLYPIAPDGGDGRWRVGRKRMEMLIEKDLVFWQKKDSRWIPYEKIYFNGGEVKTVKERSILYDLATTTDGTNELTEIFGKKDVFENPKPTELIKFFLRYGADNDSIVLDFFAGSGSTGHAVMSLNQEDKGNRQFILCTNNENKIAEEVCYPRVKKVISGYKNSKAKKVHGLGGNLKYFRTDFVDADSTDKNKKKLTEMATEMLCLKESTFEKITSKKAFKIYKNTNHYTGIIFDQIAIPDFKEAIAKLKGKFSVYVFSLGDDSFEDEFKDIKQKVKLSPIPEVILRVYRRIFK